MPTLHVPAGSALQDRLMNVGSAGPNPGEAIISGLEQAQAAKDQVKIDELSIQMLARQTEICSNGGVAGDEPSKACM